MEIQVNSLQELQDQMGDIKTALDGRKKIALYGEMGAGKTTFVRMFAIYCNTLEAPSSPTFSLINEYGYRDEAGVSKLIKHLDLYRLQHLQEALDIGIGDLLYDEHYCFIEWPQIIEPIFPNGMARIYLEQIGKQKRKITIKIEH